MGEKSKLRKGLVKQRKQYKIRRERVYCSIGEDFVSPVNSPDCPLQTSGKTVAHSRLSSMTENRKYRNVIYFLFLHTYRGLCFTYELDAIIQDVPKVIHGLKTMPDVQK